MNTANGLVSLYGATAPKASDVPAEKSRIPFSYASHFYESLRLEESSFVSNVEFAEFKSYLYRLLSAQTQRLQACEQRILQLEIENSRLRLQHETPMKHTSTCKKCTAAVLDLPLEQSKPSLQVEVKNHTLRPPISSPTASPLKQSARGHPTATEAPQQLDSIAAQKGEVHIMGGTDHYRNLNQTVEVLDDRSELWTKVCDTPAELHCVHSSAVVLEKQHVFLMNSFPELYGNIKMSFRSGKLEDWCKIPNQSNDPACLGSSASLSGKIFTVGGYHCAAEITWSSSLVPLPLNCSVLTASSSVEVYDPYKNIWNTLQSPPDRKIRPSLVSAEPHVLYSLGGLLSGEKRLCPSNAVQRYDTREGIWRRLDTMQYCRAFFGAFGTDYYLVAMGGITTPLRCDITHSTQATSTVEQYDIRMNRWGPLMPLVEKRCGFTCHVLNDDEVCILGGQNQLTFNSDTSTRILDREKYSLNGKTTQTGLLAGMDGYRFGHVSFLFE